MNLDPQSQTLGEFLEFRRRLLGKSQRALAEMADVSQAAVSQWELDQTIPEPARLRMLATLFGIDPETLALRAMAAKAKRDAA